MLEMSPFVAGAGMGDVTEFHVRPPHDRRQVSPGHGAAGPTAWPHTSFANLVAPPPLAGAVGVERLHLVADAHRLGHAVGAPPPRGRGPRRAPVPPAVESASPWMESMPIRSKRSSVARTPVNSSRLAHGSPAPAARGRPPPRPGIGDLPLADVAVEIADREPSACPAASLPLAPATRTRSGPSWAKVTCEKSATTSGGNVG